VWLFGSLAERRERLDSDVDLATEGLPRAAAVDLLAELTALFGTRVDLVLVEDAPASLRERIATSGEAL
jgi:predicted nucleotidyltransferase